MEKLKSISANKACIEAMKWTDELALLSQFLDASADNIVETMDLVTLSRILQKTSIGIKKSLSIIQETLKKQNGVTA